MLGSASRRTGRWRALLWVPALLALAACGLRTPSLPVPGPVDLSNRVRALLAGDDRSGDFHRARMELEELGPDVDTILVAIAYDTRARPAARANALLLLSERRADAALSALQWALFNAGDEQIREAAVLGLNRYVNESAEAQNAIRTAVADPSPRVRLNALQSLDVHDINSIRSMLRTERHPLVREIAVQYLAMSESRGAPLIADGTGAFRTAALETQTRLVLHPRTLDGNLGHVIGELGAELPGGVYLPLAYDVEMVQYVLPAFLSPDRGVAVFEVDRTIVLRDLERRETLYLGPGIAPRLIPFSNTFVYLRERSGPASEPMRYEVFRADFDGSRPERIGEMTVERSDEPMPFSPVRWMTVSESPEGWLLKVAGIAVFQAPHRTLVSELDVPGGGDAAQP
jgi:hypothetical protein